MIQATVLSRSNHTNFKVTLYSLPVIVQSLPSQSLEYSVNNPEHVNDQLADPQFYNPGLIDILLGSEVFYEMLGSDK